MSFSGGNFDNYSPYVRELTPRMIDIAEQIVSGNATTKGIAEALRIRPQTVKNILNVIFTRFGVESRIDLVIKHRDGLSAMNRPMATIIQMPKRPGEPEEPKITGLELSECVVLLNEIRLLKASLAEKQAHLRRCLRDGMEVEDGPLKSFVARIARGYFP